MEIEELFCKRYPEYSVNGKPLHPYFDVFEEGYEQAEKENQCLRDNYDQFKAIAEPEIERLQKEKLAEWEKEHRND